MLSLRGQRWVIQNCILQPSILGDGSAGGVCALQSQEPGRVCKAIAVHPRGDGLFWFVYLSKHPASLTQGARVWLFQPRRPRQNSRLAMPTPGRRAKSSTARARGLHRWRSMVRPLHQGRCGLKNSAFFGGSKEVKGIPFRRWRHLFLGCLTQAKSDPLLLAKSAIAALLRTGLTGSFGLLDTTNREPS